jgi:hypothetical protein
VTKLSIPNDQSCFLTKCRLGVIASYDQRFRGAGHGLSETIDSSLPEKPVYNKPGHSRHEVEPTGGRNEHRSGPTDREQSDAQFVQHGVRPAARLVDPDICVL